MKNKHVPNTTAQPPLLLSVKQAATRLQLGINRTYELVRCGELPSITVGKTIRVPAQALEEWVQENTGRHLGDG